MRTRRFRGNASWGLLITAFLMATFAVAAMDSPTYGAGRALLVGIEDYPNPKLKLRGVKDDVELMRKALTEKGVFAPSELMVLVDKQATRANIVKGFTDWLVGGTRAGDTILFYYSGHGIQVWDEIGDSEDGRAQALICWDAKILAPKEQRAFRGVPGHAWNVRKTKNLLLDHEIHGLLKMMTGRTVLFVCDSCFSGTVYKSLDPFFVQNKTIDQPEGYESVFDKRATEDVVLKARRRTSGIAGNTVIPGVSLAALLSSEDFEPSQIVRFNQEPAGFHSVFTWFFYHGLRGAAAENKDGQVTLGSLAKFVHDGIKRAGFAQTPQWVFSPEKLASLPMSATQVAAARPNVSDQAVIPVQAHRADELISRPTRIGCKVDATGVPASEIEHLKQALSRGLPSLFWTEDPNQVSCRIVLKKKHGRYGARLSDATGSSWDTNQGPSLDAVVSGLAGNLRAYAVQMNLDALKNRSSRLRFDVQIKVKSPRPRTNREVAEGDFIAFEATAKTPGYLYIFNVNSTGVINPLYPPPNAQPEPLRPDRPVLLGAGDAFHVKGPFGKEMVFAILFEKPPTNLGVFWSQHHIGTSDNQSFQPQQQFLDALWNKLTAGGKPERDWVSNLWVIKSFKE